MNKKHLALFLPHTDTTLEADLRDGLPEEWVCHTCRLYLKEVGEEAEKQMVDEALPQGLKSMKGIIPFDAAIFGCTSASAVYGKKGLARLHALMEEGLGCPAYSAFGGVKDRIEGAGRPPVALLTPYVEDVNRFFIRTLQSFDIQVACHAGLGLSQDPEIAACPPEEVLRFARGNRERIKAGGAGMVLVSCTNFRAFEVRRQLEEILGLPVITSNQCLVDWVCALP